jgi:hypothetical protein
MKYDILNIDGDDTSLRKPKRVQPSGYVVNVALQASIADQADAGTGHADRSDRRLSPALKQDWINDVHGAAIPFPYVSLRTFIDVKCFSFFDRAIDTRFRDH